MKCSKCKGKGKILIFLTFEKQQKSWIEVPFSACLKQIADKEKKCKLCKGSGKVDLLTKLKLMLLSK